MSRDEADRELARLAAGTEPIAPDAGLTEAIMSAVSAAREARDPLAEIARKTASIDADASLAEAVMARVTSGEKSDLRAPSSGRGRTGWLEGVTRTGPFALGLAALAAAASLLFFLSSERDTNAAMALSVDTVEVIE